ncbi:MAG: prepilin-type N-terminal cleavage/methylation domain-containing protein [Planctomycetes bacterium]|nr:prepilin-type N-terminal cleavage/methylation domain-containing protein [Planctomycetota bacterium]
MDKAFYLRRLHLQCLYRLPGRAKSTSITLAEQGRGACPSRLRQTGFSLVELLVVIAIVAILAGAVVTQMQPNVGEGLLATARVVASDLDRARELAVTGGSTYRVTFDTADNSYVLKHTGADSRLNTLPRSPFGSLQDSATEQTQNLSDMPRLGPQVVLWAVRGDDNSFQTIDSMEFGPLGETIRSESTVIWLASGSDAARRYIPITVNPVTGVSSIGSLQATSP